MFQSGNELSTDQFNNFRQGSQFERVELCMLWPWLDTDPEWVENAGVELKRMYFSADRRWNESETKVRLIRPILIDLLKFPALELTESPHPISRYGDVRLHPDYYLPGACVIEAKKIGVSLLSYNSEASNFRCALDQGLSYLDSYEARSCIVTNGWNWYAFWRASDSRFGTADPLRYFGARFRLDEIIEDGDRMRLGQFLSMFNATCLSDRANRAVPISGFTSYPVERRLYQSYSMLYFADESARPLRGRGSGFCSPTSTHWPMEV